MPLSDSDFDLWNEEKKRIQLSNMREPYEEGEIWWCTLGINIGSEQNGTGREHTRPVLILKKINRKTCYIIPLTTSIKQGEFRIKAGLIDGKEAMALLSQIRLIDAKRLIKKVEVMDPCLFLYMRETARSLF